MPAIPDPEVFEQQYDDELLKMADPVEHPIKDSDEEPVEEDPEEDPEKEDPEEDLEAAKPMKLADIDPT